MKVDVFTSRLTEEDLGLIESLAAENYGPSEIAKMLKMDRRAFLHVWRDKCSQLREAYDRGRFMIDQEKQAALEDRALRGDLTAIQIHDKRARAQRFEDIKKEIFCFE